MINRLALVFLFLLLVTACNKPAPPDLLREAQGYFRSVYHPDTLAALPRWDKAFIQRFSFGQGVVVPLSGGVLTIRGVPCREVSWLLLYRDAVGSWHAERVIRVPPAGAASSPGAYATPTAAAPAAPEIRVEDLAGRFLRGFLISGSGFIPVVSSRLYRSEGLSVAPPALESPPATVTPLLVNPTGPKPTTICIETDWYACSSIGDGPTQCEYAYTTEDCTGSAPVEVGPPGSTPTATDYTLVGLPSGSASAGSAGAALASIKPDTSITNHANVQCVYIHLMNPNLNHDLRKILSSFDDNQVYNVTFALCDTLGSTDGRCSYLGNNNFAINLNAAEAEDTDYSRIYLASTFIHEAFHAKLRQKAIETFGETAISSWPRPIDDMDLAELATYFEAEAKSTNIWESVEHDWMVANISSLATSLEQFVQTYYKATYTAVGSDLAPYEALMYMGLQGSMLYQEEVVGKGLDSTFTAYRGLLNEGGKCQN
jgi:hypothetical protein